MCRLVIIEKFCPGETMVAGGPVNAIPRGARRHPRRRPPPLHHRWGAGAVPARGPTEPARGLLERHQAHADIGHAPAVIAAAARPTEPAAPTSARREGGGKTGPRHAHQCSHGTRVNRCTRVKGEPCEVLDPQPSVVECHERGLDRHLHGRLGERLSPLVVRRATNADDRCLVLERHTGKLTAGRAPRQLARGSGRGERRPFALCGRAPSCDDHGDPPAGGGSLFGLAVDAGHLFFVDDSENQLNVLG